MLGERMIGQHPRGRYSWRRVVVVVPNTVPGGIAILRLPLLLLVQTDHHGWIYNVSVCYRDDDKSVSPRPALRISALVGE